MAYAQSGDMRSRNIFRSLCRPTTKEAFDGSGASLQELAAMAIPGMPNVNLAVTLLTSCVAQTVLSFNIGKSMDELQVADTVMAIIEEYPQFSIEEVATVLSQRRKRPGKLYDSLSMSDIIGWLDEYDTERDAYCEQQARVLSETPRSGKEMDYATYVKKVREAAAQGDERAKRALEDIEYNMSRRMEAQRKEESFKKWKRDYEESKKNDSNYQR